MLIYSVLMAGHYGRLGGHSKNPEERERGRRLVLPLEVIQSCLLKACMALGRVDVRDADLHSNQE